MQNWLDDFAYRAEFGAGLFIWTALAAVGIATLTVGWQSMRTLSGIPPNHFEPNDPDARRRSPPP